MYVIGQKKKKICLLCLYPHKLFSTSVILCNFMESAAAKSISTASSRLLALAQQLRLYKAEESTGKLISHVGFHKPISPAKKAAVLICLFEGDDGDLRVILTKRASGLSTHSGLLLWLFFLNLDTFDLKVSSLDVILIVWMMG